jgi:hypothetical protein
LLDDKDWIQWEKSGWVDYRIKMWFFETRIQLHLFSAVEEIESQEEVDLFAFESSWNVMMNVASVKLMNG